MRLWLSEKAREVFMKTPLSHDQKPAGEPVQTSAHRLARKPVPMEAWVIATRPYPEKVLGYGNVLQTPFAAGGVFFLDRVDAEKALVERRAEMPEVANSFGIFPALITVFEAGQKPMIDDDLITRAARFADEKHAGQKRKYTEAPYITHPGRVAARVTLLDGSVPEMVAAAWLHDVVEDTGTPIREIEARFGEAVAELVMGLTHVYTSEAYPDLNRKQRKQREYERIAKLPVAVRRIKLLDRIDNLGEIDPLDDFTRVYMLESQILLDSVRGTDAALEGELVEVLRKLASVRAQMKAGV